MSIVIDHVGLRASDLAASRRMYEAALAELGFMVLNEGEFEDDAYSGTYYAAFVLDPDGNNVEAVFHTTGPVA